MIVYILKRAHAKTPFEPKVEAERNVKKFCRPHYLLCSCWLVLVRGRIFKFDLKISRRLSGATVTATPQNPQA